MSWFTAVSEGWREPPQHSQIAGNAGKTVVFNNRTMTRRKVLSEAAEATCRELQELLASLAVWYR